METIIINGFRHAILTGDDSEKTVIYLLAKWDRLSGDIRMTIKRELSAYIASWDIGDCHLKENTKQLWINFYNKINDAIIPRFDEYMVTEKNITCYI